MFFVGMRASGGDMHPSYEEVLRRVKDLEDAMAAVVADAENSQFFGPFTKAPPPSRDPMIIGGSSPVCPFHSYYICEGELGEKSPWEEIMSKRRISFSRASIRANGFPPVSEWKWRDPLI